MARPKTDVTAARESLIAAAADLMVEVGGDDLTVSAIATRQGMSQSNAYRFFKNKDELMRALAKRWFDPLIELAEELQAGNLSPKSRLERYVLSGVELYRYRYNHDARRFDGYMSLAKSYPDAIAEHVDFLLNRMVDWVKEAVAETGASEEFQTPAALLFLDMTLMFRNPNFMTVYAEEMTVPRAKNILRAFFDIISSPERLRAALYLEGDDGEASA